MSDTKEILVYADWIGLDGPCFMGKLSVDLSRGEEVYRFEFSKKWLESGRLVELDPDLSLFPGPLYRRDGSRKNFGVFLDSAPDRWGSVLMQRREAIMARREERTPKKLYPSDYLLGVFDQTRMGALRFKLSENGPFLDNQADMSTPPWTRIRELEAAVSEIESDRDVVSPWVINLLAPGSSLGGARPKANVLDQDGSLWIAKFPSQNDKFDVGAWEYVTYELARQCGIVMAESKAQAFSGKNHTFLTRRFDRITGKGRLHFASAMTLLRHNDGDDFRSGGSYLELVRLITTKGENVDADLEQLWRRIVFSILVHNTDDHFRNHGFILGTQGWRLSPAYDINPNPDGTGLCLNINTIDNSLDLILALEVATYFRLNYEKANSIISEIKKGVSRWRDIIRTKGIHISAAEQDRMSHAFEAR